jgi:fumarylacetoacetase
MDALVEINKDSEFSIHNLPYGIFSQFDSHKRVGVAIGDFVLDLDYLNKNNFLATVDLPKDIFFKDYLNDFMVLGKKVGLALRKKLTDLIQNPSDDLKNHLPYFCFKQSEITLHLPIHIGDYTDFYSSEQHARNVGMMFRDPENALLPNWKHLPVAYHGRSSSIKISGTNFYRPKGQIQKSGNIVFETTKKLDVELEMATVIGKNSELGNAINVDEAEHFVFGFLVFNDWSARDIQAWEYVPLGPFLGKNFFSSVSPWVVTLEALEPFSVPVSHFEKPLLPYLNGECLRNFDISMEIILETPSGSKTTLAKSNFKNLYWTVAQQVAHHTANGCDLRVGDLLASGTISGSDPKSFGSLLELSWNGQKPIVLSDGSERCFVEDGDTIVLKAFAEKNGVRIGFGEVRNTVLPAKTQ